MSLWDDEEEGQEFRDIPEETGLDANGQPMQSAPVQVTAQRTAPAPAPTQAQVAFNAHAGKFEEAEQQYESDPIEEAEIEEDYTAIFNDANLRIEQGKLYQMIINHPLFEGMDADSRAIENVQKEIRKFARERMEIMLGMRQEQKEIQMVSSPFNDLEVHILKKIASTATQGATESPEANQVAAAVTQAPKRKTLNSIGGSTGLKRAPAPQHPSPPQSAQPQRKLPAKPAAPIQRTKSDQVIDQILAEEGLTRADLELEYVGIGKKLHELTAEELAQRQKAAQARLAKRKTVKSDSAIPMATPEQEEFLAVQRATQMRGVHQMDGLKIPGGMTALLDKVNKMPIKNP